MKKNIFFLGLFFICYSVLAQFGHGSTAILNSMKNAKLYVITNIKAPNGYRTYGKGKQERDELAGKAFEKYWDFCPFEVITEKDFRKMKGSERKGNFFLFIETALSNNSPGSAMLTIGKDDICHYYSKKYVASLCLMIRRLDFTSNDVFITFLYEEARVLNNYLKEASEENTFDLESKINNRSSRLKDKLLVVLKNSFGFTGDPKLKQFYKYKLAISENLSGKDYLDPIQKESEKMLFMLGYGERTDYVCVVDPSTGELIFITKYINKGFVKGEYSTDSLEQLNNAVGKATGE